MVFQCFQHVDKLQHTVDMIGYCQLIVIKNYVYAGFMLFF